MPRRFDTCAPTSRAYNAASPISCLRVPDCHEIHLPPLAGIRRRLRARPVSTRTVAADLAYPPTVRKPVVDTYHGVAVTDDYRWLEDDNSADVKAWVDAQNKLARAYLDSIAQRPEIARRVGELLRAKTIRRYGFEFRQRLFAMKLAPPANQPMLVVLPPDGNIAKETVVLDPNALDAKGRTTIDFYRASYRRQARRRVAVDRWQRSGNGVRLRRGDAQAPARRRPGQ